MTDEIPKMRRVNLGQIRGILERESTLLSETTAILAIETPPGWNVRYNFFTFSA
jgi:hypothetical protein